MSAISKIPRLDGASVWAGLPDEVKDRIGALSIELIGASCVAVAALQFERGEQQQSAAWLRAASAFDDAQIVEALDMTMADVLPAGVFYQDPPAGDPLFDRPIPRLPSLWGQICRRCGCSTMVDLVAVGVIEQLHWVEDDLCSGCAAVEEIAP